MKKMLEDYGFSRDVMTIYCDDPDVISISKNHMQYSRTKHTYMVESNIVSLEHVNIEHQLADLFTKSLNGLRFEFLTKVISVFDMP